MEKKNRKAKKEIHKIWKDYLKNKTEKDFTTLYIHVPYCTQKCNYCEYFSKISDTISDDHIDYLEKQFKEASPFFKDEKIKALNFGGGTPNVLSPKQLERILNMIQKYWNLELDIENEMGFEFNPYHLTDEHIKVLKNSFINRLSMGVQSFDKNVLQKENRLYCSPERINEIYTKCKDFTRMINVDLLAGLYDQTSEILVKDTKTLLDINLEEITIYELNRIGKRNNKESEREYINNMLLDVYHTLGNYPNYRYVGTTDEQFEHCNKFYKLGNTFKYFYNPAPQGYNNIIAFNIDDYKLKKYPYSHFIPINKGYQKLSHKKTLFYDMDNRAEYDRPWWKKSFIERNKK